MSARKMLGPHGGTVPRGWMVSASLVLAALVALAWFGTRADVARPQADAAGPQATTVCHRMAAPGGSDRGAGTAAEPFRTVRRLADSLSPGQTGCLRGGTFTEQVKVRSGGRSGAPITIAAAPGERPRLEGRLVIDRGADFVTVSGLALDGSTSPRCRRGASCTVLPSPTVYGDRVELRGNDITNPRGICVILGRSGDPVVGPVIAGNRIHRCGRLPRTNHDHGVYVENAIDGRIVANVIYDNADRGVQLYPSAQRMRIAGNVIDGNGQGVIFSAAGRVSSNDNVVESNVIANSRARHNVESYYPSGAPIGRGNVVRGNCLFGGLRNPEEGGVQSPPIGFIAAENRIGPPGYVDRASGDFRLRPDSPCQGILTP